MIAFAEPPAAPECTHSHPVLHRMLHHLWTKAHDGPDYVKDEWTVLWVEVEALVSEVTALKSQTHTA